MKLNSLILVGMSSLTFGLAGCPDETVADGCETATDCAAGELCVDGKCIGGRSDSGVVFTACNSDEQCQAIDPQYICNASGLCDLPAGGDPCTTTAECPIDQFCNSQSQVCVPLQTGFCREESQCSGDQCSAPAGGVGRCVECLQDSHCASNNCLANGTCAEDTCNPPCGPNEQCNLGHCVPVAGECNPPCLDTEQCVQGVCYGENGCPRNAHPEGDQCACNDGFVPNPAGSACVPMGADGGPTCDPASQQACQSQGGTWDAVNCVCLSGGTCDPPCPAGSTCQNNSCIAVTGSCTSDMDCLASGSLFMVCDPQAMVCTCDALTGFIACIISGMDFDPNLCDCDWSQLEEPDAGVPDAARADRARTDAARPDAGASDAARPDTSVFVDAAGTDAARPDAGDDVCAQNGYYGDNECDVFCPQPDPDCVGQTGWPCADDGECTSSQTYYQPFCGTGWPGGSCTAACDGNGDCDFGAWCICVASDFFGCYESYCYRGCTEDDHCREDYECVLGEPHTFSDDEYICAPAQ